MKFKVRISDKHGTSEAVLDRGGCFIGRKNSDLCLNDPYCSSSHAKVFANFDGRLWIKDLGSRNGVYVNGSKIDACAIRVGDKIQIGHTQITLLEEYLVSKEDPSGNRLISLGNGEEMGEILLVS